MGWDENLLLKLGDNKISEEELKRELAVPLFRRRRLCSLFNTDFRDQRIIDLFGQTLSRLPEETFYLLALGIPNLYFHNAEIYGQIWQLQISKPEEPVNLCTFDFSGLRDAMVVATIAHELAHLSLGHQYRTTIGLNLDLEREADEEVRRWGFGDELDLLRGHLKKSRKEENDDGRIRKVV